MGVRRSRLRDVGGNRAYVNTDPYASQVGAGITFSSATSDNFRKYSASAPLAFGTNDIWVDIVCKTTDTTGAHYLVTTTDNSAPTPPGIACILTDAKMGWHVVADDNSFDNNLDGDASALFDGAQHLLRYTFNRAGNATARLDGSIITTFPIASIAGQNITSTGTAVCIYPWNANSFFDGTIFEVAIGTGTAPVRTSPYAWLSDSTTGLVAHWKMNETSGNITDSKNGIILTASGSPTYNT